MTINENKNNFLPELIKILHSNEWIYLYIRIAFYLITVWGLVWFFVLMMPMVDEFKSSINTIKESKVLTNWKWEFVWMNKEVEYLKSFLKKQEILVKEKNKWLNEKLNNLVPNEIDNGIIVRFFEELFLSLSSNWNEMVLESINISSPIIDTISIWDKKINYKKYPVNVSFISSYNKKMQFFDIIQASWSNDERYYFKWQALPLMTVSSISLNIDGRKSNSEKQSQNISFFIYSYNEKDNI